MTKEALQQTVTDVTEENVKLKARVEELEDRVRMGRRGESGRRVSQTWGRE